MNEFDLIKKLFAPLAKDFPGSFNLTDDAATVLVPAGYELVVTTDAIVEGVHFIGDESPDLIAKKLLRVNLSDLAAMGAKPYCYFLAVMINKNININWIKGFAKGLREDQKRFKIHLAGGDTTAASGPSSFCVTAMGLVKKNTALRRNGAHIGDDIYVSGTMGDGALGLTLLSSPWKGEDEGGSPLSAKSNLSSMPQPDPHPNLPPSRGKEFLIRRYLLPEPRVALGEQLHGIATSCMDISDGLVQDLGHICAASKTGAVIRRNAIPLSPAAAKMVKKNPALWEKILGGGDDYELLFTAPASKSRAIAALAKKLKLPITRIGTMGKGGGVKVLDERGRVLKIKHKGFRHF